VAGLGADLKGTFCFIREDAAYLSQHLGDLELSLSRDFYRESFRFFRKFLDAEPVAVCHDLHPAYFTTSFAEELAGSARLFALQHHKAHMYSVMAETGFRGKAVGVAFDGTGYGEDGTVWGGEFFAVDGDEVTRAGHLSRFPLPGGTPPCGSRGGPPCRSCGRSSAARRRKGRRARCSPGSPKTRSGSCSTRWTGDQCRAHVQRRAALRRRLGDRRPVRAVELRGAGADAPRGGRLPEGAGMYPFSLVRENGLLAVNWKETVAGLVADAKGRVPQATISRRFHDTLAAVILGAASAWRRPPGRGT
jgi:hydrogenase maturation protein HypF